MLHFDFGAKRSAYSVHRKIRCLIAVFDGFCEPETASILLLTASWLTVFHPITDIDGIVSKLMGFISLRNAFR